MVVVGHRDDGGAGPGHDAAWIFPLLRLPMQVPHRAGVTRCEPPVELGSVRVAIEPRDPGCRKAQLGSTTFDRDHSPIVSRRQRAKLTTSSTGGMASSSPYAGNNPQCIS